MMGRSTDLSLETGPPRLILRLVGCNLNKIGATRQFGWGWISHGADHAAPVAQAASLHFRLSVAATNRQKSACLRRSSGGIERRNNCVLQSKILQHRIRRSFEFWPGPEKGYAAFLQEDHPVG